MKSPISIFAIIASLFLVATGYASDAAQATGASDETYALKEVHTMPRPRGRRAEPVYPFELKKKKISGEAILGFVVNAQGDVEQVRVIRASHEQFGQAAKSAVEKWKFTPARKDGRPVNCRMQIPIAFNLNR